MIERIEQLEATVKQLKLTRRRKVIVDPNGVFATIDNTNRAQCAVGRGNPDSEESSSSGESESEDSEAEDCILAAV